MSKPNLTYSYFAYGAVTSSTDPTIKTVVLDHLPTEDDDPVKVSFQSGFNTITIKYTPDIPLRYFQVRIHDGEDWGIDKGTRWYYAGPNIEGSTEQSFTLNINSTYFPGGITPSETTQLIGLYGKSADSDGYWDVTYLFLTTEADGTHKLYAPKDYDGLSVIADDPVPDN